MLVIRSKCQGGQRWSREGEKNSRGAVPPCPLFCAYKKWSS